MTSYKKHPTAPTQLLIHIYDGNHYQQTDVFQPELIKNAIAHKQHVWINITGLANVQQITHLCDELAIHPLVIENILNPHQRPKLSDLDDSLFIVFRLLNITNNTHPTYHSEQFSMILKKNLLLTFSESPKCDLTSLYHRLRSEDATIRKQGCGYLSYLIIDCIMDDYSTLIEESEYLLENMENLLIHPSPSVDLSSLYTIKKRLMTLRKVIAPLKDVIHVLIREHEPFIDAQYLLYYRDLLDRSTRLLESIDLQREMSNSILEIYLSTLNTRMNETMKILTIFASLFIPLTFIAGIYGMNFVYMPELKWRYSYPAILLIMVLLAIVMFYYFKRKKLL